MGKYINYEVKALMILRNNNGDLLLLKNDHKESIIFGYVNPPAGHLEMGETILDVVPREAKEEMGINRLEDIQLKGVVNVEGFKELPILMFVVSAMVPKIEKPIRKSEGTPIWVNPKELGKYKVLEDVKKIIEVANKTPVGRIFQAVSKFEDKKLVYFQVKGQVVIGNT